MNARNKFRKEWDWFCGRVNFGDSAMDARAIGFMNEIEKYLDSIEAESKEDESMKLDKTKRLFADEVKFQWAPKIEPRYSVKELEKIWAKAYSGYKDDIAFIGFLKNNPAKVKEILEAKNDA
jgi:hypothetical protein